MRPLWRDDFRGRDAEPALALAAPARRRRAGRSAADGLMLATQDADLYVDRNTASVLQARAAGRRLPRRGRAPAGRAGRLLRHRGAGRLRGDARRRQLRQAGRDGARRPAPGRVREGAGARSSRTTRATATRWPARPAPPPGCASMSTAAGGRNVIRRIRARTGAPGSAAAPGRTASARTPVWASSRWAAPGGTPPSCGSPSARLSP